MKIKIGPVEVEQDSINDEVLFDRYKKEPKEVQKYLVEKSKYYDLTLKNIIAGKTMNMIKNFVISIAALIFFTGWSLYVFYVSKDAFTWQEMNLESTMTFILEALLILAICFLPVGLVAGFLKFVSKKASSKEE